MLHQGQTLTYEEYASALPLAKRPMPRRSHAKPGLPARFLNGLLSPQIFHTLSPDCIFSLISTGLNAPESLPTVIEALIIILMSTHKTIQATFFRRQARDMRERAEMADTDWARHFFARLAWHYEQEIALLECPHADGAPRPASSGVTHFLPDQS